MSLKTICVLPFNTLSIGSTGDQRLCCNAINGGLGGPDRPPLVTERNSTDWLQGQALSRIRSALSSGTKITECDRCWRLEDIGSESYRNMNNSFRFPETYERLLAGDLTVKLERLELDLGNKCNLACRMCHPGSSKLLAEELQKSGIKEFAGVPITRYTEMDTWVKRSKLFEVIKEYGSTLKSVYIIGGEPLVIQEQEELLDLLIELDYAKNIELEYNTNITTLGSKWYDKWENFKSVNIGASIDGVGEHYNYVRWPANWNKIYSNLKELKAWGDEKPGKRKVGIHSTLSNLTISCYTETVDTLIKELGFNLFFINVDHPECMSPWVLPDSVKNDIAQKAIDHTRTYYSDNFNLMNTVNTLEKVLTTTVDVSLKKQFIAKMKYMDSHRKQNLLDLHPWFKEWYDL